MTSGVQLGGSGSIRPPAAHQQTLYYNPNYYLSSLFHDPSTPKRHFRPGPYDPPRIGHLCRDVGVHRSYRSRQRALEHQPDPTLEGTLDLGENLGGPSPASLDWEKLIRNNGNNWNGDETCNNEVIDLSINSSKVKKSDKLAVKQESINDICSRLSEDKGSTESCSTEIVCPDTKGTSGVVAKLSAPKTGPGCSRTSAVITKSGRQGRQHPRLPKPDVPTVSVKNEPTSFHGYRPMFAPQQYLGSNALPMSDVYHSTRLDLVGSCINPYGPTRNDVGMEHSLHHDFLNTRLNPCYLAGNLSMESHYPASGYSMSRWSDASYISPFQMGPVASSSSSLLDPSPFDFSNPLGIKQETTVPLTPATTAVDGRGRDTSYVYPRQATSSSSGNVNFRLPPVGFEILRDPVTGKYLLIPAASIEAIHRALFWPGYQPPPLLPISNDNSESEKRPAVPASIKEESCSVSDPAVETPRNEDTRTRTQVMRNWLVEKIPKAVKEEDPPSVDVSGLELLSRGIEKIERETDTRESKMSGLGLLCALAEQRMKDEIDVGEEGAAIPDTCPPESVNKAEDVKAEEIMAADESDREVELVEKSGIPKKIRYRRNDINGSPIKDVVELRDMSPPVLEKVTDFPPPENSEAQDGEAKTEPPTLTPNNEDEKPSFGEVEEVEASVDDEGDCLVQQAQEGDNDGKEKNEEDANDNEAIVAGNIFRKRKLPSGHSGESKKRKSTKPKISHNQSSLERGSGNTSEKGKPISRSNVASYDYSTFSNITESEELTCLHEEGKTGKLVIKLRRNKAKPPVDTHDVGEHEAPKSCVLTTDSLVTDQFPIRILTVDGGLFYTGQLSAIQPPDVYGITIDGERGNRPHIYSREEVLNNSILEVKPSTASDLKPGARICAFWSGQYRCLYPGTVSSSACTDQESDDAVSVEFDDGDSCRISMDDIRLLPDNYPITEYDPNPLQSLAKKKRKANIKPEESIRNLPPSEEGHSNTSVKMEGAGEAVEIESGTPSQDQVDDVYVGEKCDRRLRKKLKRERRRLQCRETGDGILILKRHKKHKKHRHRHGKKRRNDNEGSPSSYAMQSSSTSQDLATDSVDNPTSSGECLRHSDKKKKELKKKNKRSGRAENSPEQCSSQPERELWSWSGKGSRRAGVKGKARKEYYKAIQRGRDRIVNVPEVSELVVGIPGSAADGCEAESDDPDKIGECAVFLSTGRPDRPFIGRIESMWETWGANMVVRVKWFYHPEETVGCPATLEYPGALFESPHSDENDVQTISHKCEVLPLKKYIEKLGKGGRNYEGSTTLFYLAGFYDPTNTSLQFQEGVK